MANEKTAEQMRIDAQTATEMGKDKLTHAPSPYTSKKRRYDSSRPKEQFFDKEIGVGSFVIIRFSKNRNVLGYALGEILDFDDELNYWNESTDIYVRVVEISAYTLEKEMNRIRLVRSSSWLYSRMELVDVGKGNWAKYKVKEA